MSPEIVEPLFWTELATMTAMNCGTVAGGVELPPGLLVQLPPQAGLVLLPSKPLNELGPDPPLIDYSVTTVNPEK
jgi:hypothetical protein